MEVFPALSFQMSTWSYYVIKMSANELSENVRFASEVHQDRTLDLAIQRELRSDRVRKEIVKYLQYQPDRFFSSIVIAALDGNPKFHRQNGDFGFLEFDGTQKYYALDGQHRLSAIKILMDRDDPLSEDIPEDFGNDEFSVIVIVPQEVESREDFMKKYRKLFSTLNRYAKKTDQATNIIMDEDDTFAILTRRLIMDYSFFQWTGHWSESERIKTTRGKALNTGEPYFTSIEILYDMNIALLSSRERTRYGWGPDPKEREKNLKIFKQVRPSDEYIDELYDELEMYWDGLLDELPVLRDEHPIRMRYHEVVDRDRYSGDDHLLFWPIGQQLLSDIARMLLDKRSPNPGQPTCETVRFALKGLGKLEWRLHRSPWQYFLINQTVNRKRERKWKMRSEDRKPAISCAYDLLSWLLGLGNYDNHFIANLKERWESFLIPKPREEIVNELWEQFKDQKLSISRYMSQ